MKKKQVEDAILLLTQAGVIKWTTRDNMAEANLHLMLIDMRGNDKPRPKFEMLVVHPHVSSSDAVASVGGVYGSETATHLEADTNKKLVTTVFGSDKKAAEARAVTAGE